VSPRDIDLLSLTDDPQEAVDTIVAADAADGPAGGGMRGVLPRRPE
jgi:hypothetical protein